MWSPKYGLGKVWKGKMLNDNFCQLQTTAESLVTAVSQEQDMQSRALPSAVPFTLRYHSNFRVTCLHDLTSHKTLSPLVHGGTWHSSHQHCNEQKPSVMCRREPEAFERPLLYKVVAPVICLAILSAGMCNHNPSAEDLYYKSLQCKLLNT